MKRMKRWTALLAALILCLSLCGCDHLDELRASHAVWQEDGTILWNGAVYKTLPDTYAEINTLLTGDQTVYVTAADVPVLLSAEFSDYFESDAKGIFLAGYVGSGDEYGDEYKLFCREDRYDEFAATLKDGFVFKGYCYDYFDYTKGGQTTYYLTVEQEYAISYIVDTVIPTEYTDYPTEDYVKVYAYNEGDLHRSYCCDLVNTGDAYYIVYYDLSYLVPESYYYHMLSIFEAKERGDDSRWEATDTYYVK